jgi:hypothetical protein
MLVRAFLFASSFFLPDKGIGNTSLNLVLPQVSYEDGIVSIHTRRLVGYSILYIPKVVVNISGQYPFKPPALETHPIRISCGFTETI